MEGVVYIYFRDGKQSSFLDCKNIQETEELITFTQVSYTAALFEVRNRFVFKKSQLSGWGLPREK